jgi:hypothetical protein
VMLLSASITNVMWCFPRGRFAYSLGGDDIHHSGSRARQIADHSTVGRICVSILRFASGAVMRIFSGDYS